MGNKLPNQPPPRMPEGNANVGPFQDRTQRSAMFDYDIPNDDGLWEEVTRSFGSLRTITVTLLTPLQEKHAAQTAKGDMLMTSFELAKRTIIEVTNSDGERFPIQYQGGGSDELWGQMHPKIRSMVVQAYAANSSPKESASDLFMASRKIRA